MVNSSNTLFNHFLVGRCVLCQQHLSKPPDICQDCASDLPWIKHCCQACALPLTDARQSICRECLRSPPAFSHTVAAWRYDAPVAQLISQFKYHRHFAYGNTLCQLAAKMIVSAYNEQSHSTFPDALIPVPMHWLRLFRRGFNHGELIAHHLGQQLGIAVLRGLKRHQNTASQRSLNAAERRQNLRRAFSLAVSTRHIQGKRLALVDDVMTTGATARELSRQLLKAGASEVHIWILARTPQDNNR